MSACECGCGEDAGRYINRSRGEFRRYLPGHHTVRPRPRAETPTVAALRARAWRVQRKADVTPRITVRAS